MRLGNARAPWLLVIVTALLPAICAAADRTSAPVLFAVGNDSALPLAGFAGDQLTSGIMMDLGQAIANRLHRRAEFVALPRKRLDDALASGAVDGACYLRPAWMDAKLNWGPTLISNDILLVAATGVPRPTTLMDAAGKSIGIVLGYKYPELDALGQNYKSEIAPNMASNISKLIAGRMDYAVVDRLSLEYQAKSRPELNRFVTMIITKVNTSCAFSPRSKLSFEEVSRAMRAMVDDRTVDAILARYR